MSDPGNVEQASGRRAAVLRTLVLEDALAETVAWLTERGIDSVLLKGAGTARWLYDDPHERRYRDLDLLVAPAQFGRAQAALAQIGFEPEYDPGTCDLATPHHEVLIRHGVSEIRLELHRSLALASAPAAQVCESLSAGAQIIELAGVPVRVPSPPAGALVVALHAAQHGVAERTPMADLERAVARVQPQTWEAAAALARDLGMVCELAAGLRLTAAGCELAARLGLGDQPVSRRLRLRLMTAPSSATGFEELANAPGIISRARLLAAKLAPPPILMRRWKPVARCGRWGLACAYLWRPFWLAYTAPRGILVWLRARQATDRPGI